MKFLRSNLAKKIIMIVGLIVALALLFWCFAVAWKNGDMQAFLKKCQEGSELFKETSQEIEDESEADKMVLNADTPMIALTFDDGPSKYTDELLNILQENDARASFFVLGQRVVQYPEKIARMEEIGCEIGNHTFNHLNLTTIAPEQILTEIEQTNDTIRNVLGDGAKFVRPPYGATNDVVIANTAYPIALWSVDTTDWQLKDAAAVAQYLLTTVQDGDVVLLHDIYESTLEAMRIVIPELKARGYQLVTFSEMAEAHGVALESRQEYFEFK